MTDLHKIEDITDLRNGFVETLTHDIKTPVIAQMRILELLISGYFGKLNKNQLSVINETLDASKYMYEMISALVSTYRFENSFDLNYSSFDFVSMVELCIKDIDKFLKINNLKVIIVPEISNSFVFGDEIKIKKVLSAIFFNILNLAFKNSIIKIYITETNNMLNFTAEYHSCYIKPEKLKSVFDFHHSEYYDKLGSGIGLYLAKKIIEKHSGKIFAKSYTNQKNIIGFEIPINNNKLNLCLNFA